MPRIPIGVQLYSVRDDCKRDLKGTLTEIARMGYQGVEFAGFYDYPAADLRTMLDDVGLKCCGSHTSLGLLLGDALNETVEFHRALGNKYVVVPSLPAERRDSLATWQSTAKVFSDIAARLKPHGLLTGYHNHAVEFQPVEGKIPWHVFFEATSPDVIMQTDLGNAMHGGGDPIAALKAFPGRSITVHLKEHSHDRNAMIGEGLVDWQSAFSVCESSGKTEWYIVEQESYPYPPLECIRRCLDNLRKMGK